MSTGYLRGKHPKRPAVVGEPSPARAASIHTFKPRAGAVRYKSSHGGYESANPGDRMYSTMLFLATEQWDVSINQWVVIEE